MKEKTTYDIQIDDLESATARELVALGPRRGLRIGVHPVVILLCELVVVAARAYTDGPYESFLDRFAESMEPRSLSTCSSDQSTRHLWMRSIVGPSESRDREARGS